LHETSVLRTNFLCEQRESYSKTQRHTKEQTKNCTKSCRHDQLQMPKATSTTIAWVLSIIASSGILVKGQSELGSMVYNCSLPGLEDFTPGQYGGGDRQLFELLHGPIISKLSGAGRRVLKPVPVEKLYSPMRKMFGKTPSMTWIPRRERGEKFMTAIS
jgi:hypothetical protein